jgi:hypothetical protein
MGLRFTRLTRPNIRALKPGERITEHGITADCLTNGDVRYSVTIMVDGHRIHRVIGRDSDNTTRTQAEMFIEKVRSEAREDRLSLSRGRKTPLMFSKAAAIYLDGEMEVGAKDLVSKEAHLRLHLVPYFGQMRIERISKFTVEKFRNDMLKRGHSTGQVNRVLSTYRHLGNRLAERAKIQMPLPMIKLKEPDNRRNRVLTFEEENAQQSLLLALCEDWSVNQPASQRNSLHPVRRLRCRAPKASGAGKRWTHPRAAAIHRNEAGPSS